MANWLQRTVNVPDVIDVLIQRFGDDQIDTLTSTENYADAQAVLALGFNQAIEKTNLSRRRKQAAVQAMFDDLMTAASIVYLLGYQAKEDEATSLEGVKTYAP
jgi:hypothetical protein